jgi:aldehyde dehydrogenase (NAD+)
MRKSQMEMGGKNPFVVLADADLSIAADCVVNGAFFSTGQRCTASSRIIVDKAVYSGFVDLLAERIQGLRIGHALRDDTQIGPVVDESQLSQNESYIAKGKAEGARLVTGGDRLNRDTEGFFQSPALFADCTNDMVIAREEIFGPVAAVIPVDGYDEALAVANDTPFGLSAGIATTSLKHATDFRRNAEAGMVMINLPTAGVDFHVPFGGRKASSFGPANRDAMPPNFSPRSRPLTRSPNAGQCKGPTP